MIRHNVAGGGQLRVTVNRVAAPSPAAEQLEVEVRDGFNPRPRTFHVSLRATAKEIKP